MADTLRSSIASKLGAGEVDITALDTSPELRRPINSSVMFCRQFVWNALRCFNVCFCTCD